MYNDLQDWPVQILDGGEVFVLVFLITRRVCNVGIESTVIGIDCEKKQIILFRRGGITEGALCDCLRKGGFDMTVNEPVKHVPMAMKEAQVAPGQLITHYAPYCDTYLVCAIPIAYGARSI